MLCIGDNWRNVSHVVSASRRIGTAQRAVAWCKKRHMSSSIWQQTSRGSSEGRTATPYC